MNNSRRKIAYILLIFAGVLIFSAVSAYNQPFGYAGAILIGAVQGLTEFLPISSTAHLLFVEFLLNIDLCRNGTGIQPTEILCTFDVILQIGTILAAIIFFKRELRTIWRQSKKEKFFRKNSLIILFCSFIPVGAVGFIFRHKIAQLYQLHIIEGTLILGALIIFYAEKFFKQRHEMPVIRGLIPSLRQSIVVSFWQCLALIPGVSRSMSTIVGGYSCGLDREIAVKFSFLLGLLTCFVASSYKLLFAWDKIFNVLPVGITLVGIASSTLTSLAVIRFCINYMIRNGLNVFAYYRTLLAVFIYAIF